jgi:hypothetical protein
MKQMNKLFLTFMVIMGIVVLSCTNNNDYYKTGELISLHRHTAGNGIAIVFLGDGFDREDCRKGGVYEENCRKMTELFLSMPLIRDFKDYFEICARVDVSNERGVRNCVADPATCPDNAYSCGHPDLNWDKIRSNATLAAGKNDRSVIFMGNGMIGGYAMGDVAVYSANEEKKAFWMMHEFVGHIVGCMPDLYVEEGDTVNASVRKTIDENHAVGELSMLDWRKDAKTVFWKDFIGRPGYEKVSVYPSGWYGIKLGELSTCEDHRYTVMSWGRVAYFNVMERYQLWRKIQSRAGFSTVTFDRFIEYDAVNLKKETDWSWTPYKALEWTDERIWK